MPAHRQQIAFPTIVKPIFANSREPFLASLVILSGFTNSAIFAQQRMTKKLQHFISVLLVFVLLTPMIVKLFDSRYHHHDHFICTAKNERHLHEYHDRCAITGFEFSLNSLNKIIPVTQKTYYFELLLTNYISLPCCSNSKYSFSLRAPPLNS